MITRTKKSFYVPPVLNDKAEQHRLEVVDIYRQCIIGGPSFEFAAQMMANTCDCPIAVVSLIGKHKQYFLSHVGTEESEVRRELSFCWHTVEQGGYFEVSDLTRSPMFSHHPFVMEVPHYRFYAAAPLMAKSGEFIGTVYVMDYRPRHLNQAQKDFIVSMAGQVMVMLEMKRTSREMESKARKLSAMNEGLTRFAYTVAHDIRSPLRNISALSSILEEEFKDVLDEDGLVITEAIRKKSQEVNDLVDGILHYSTAKGELQPEDVKLQLLLKKVIDFVQPPPGFSIETDIERDSIWADPIALHQVLQNLVSNAVRYNDKAEGVVKITVKGLKNNCVELSVSDNGPGIPESERQRIFQPFHSSSGDRFGKKGFGIGLATVRRIVTKMDGTISLSTRPGEGCTFRIVFPERHSAAA